MAHNHRETISIDATATAEFEATLSIPDGTKTLTIPRRLLHPGQNIGDVIEVRLDFGGSLIVGRFKLLGFDGAAAKLESIDAHAGLPFTIS